MITLKLFSFFTALSLWKIFAINRFANNKYYCKTNTNIIEKMQEWESDCV